MFLQGIHYRSLWFYQFMDVLKLGIHKDARYHIAREFIGDPGTLVDVCAGNGSFRRYLPSGCRYIAVDASPEFLARAGQRAALTVGHDLHRGWPAGVTGDVLTMLISLCQFRETSAPQLLDAFKSSASRVVIVEDVVERRTAARRVLQRVMNYLCGREYFVPMSLFTVGEFEELMKRHGYRFIRYNERYCVGYFEKGAGKDVG